MKALITGFDPFGGESLNPAYEVVSGLESQIGDCQIVKLEVPTVFGRCLEVLESSLTKEKPDIVICLGQAGGETGIRLEKVAINLNDARISDNKGNQPTDEPIYADGENAYFTSLPIKAISKALKDQGIPSSISYTAGTFVCNHLFYGLMYMIKKNHPYIKGGFIHIPYLPEQVVDKAKTASMSLDMMLAAIKIIIETSTQVDQDIHLTAGTLD